MRPKGRRLHSADIQMRDKMRRVFSTPEGQDVLEFLLVDLGTFDHVDGGYPLALRNYGIRLLELMDIYHAENLAQIVGGYLKTPARCREGERKNV